MWPLAWMQTVPSGMAGVRSARASARVIRRSPVGRRARRAVASRGCTLPPSPRPPPAPPAADVGWDVEELEQARQHLAHDEVLGRVLALRSEEHTSELQ